MAEGLCRLAADALQVLHTRDVVDADTEDGVEPADLVTFTNRQQIKTSLHTSIPCLTRVTFDC